MPTLALPDVPAGTTESWTMTPFAARNAWTQRVPIVGYENYQAYEAASAVYGAHLLKLVANRPTTGVLGGVSKQQYPGTLVDMIIMAGATSTDEASVVTPYPWWSRIQFGYCTPVIPTSDANVLKWLGGHLLEFAPSVSAGVPVTTTIAKLRLLSVNV